MPPDLYVPPRVLLVVALAVALPGCADSTDSVAVPGEAPRLELGPASRLGGDFTRVMGARELADGTVWVADGRELSLKRIAVASEPPDSIRSVGEGPLDYEYLEGVFALANDTTAIWDATKLLLIHDGRIVGGSGQTFAGLLPVGAVIGVDSIGGVLVMSLTSDPPDETGDGRLVRSYAILARSDRELSFRDTVAVLQRGTRVIRRREPGGPFVSSATEDSRSEGVAYFSDGWIAIVRAEPYVVEWIDPEGATTATDPIPVDPGFPAPAIRLGATDPVPTSDGSVLVPLQPSAALGDSTRYDVVSRAGLEGYIVLPPDRDVVAAGPNSLYITATDELGLQRIDRVAWPPRR